ncbi:MAG TPA: hypothetical protein DEP05_05580, partial [Betaproteobacteria bacterium]|nr:hypothetical protein [Betaproteobacteria bacterium]
MATIGEAAIFAANVYFAKNTVKGLQVTEGAPIGVPTGWRLDRVIDHTNAGGDYVAVYVNPQTKELFLAGRGTVTESDLTGPDMAIMLQSDPLTRERDALSIAKSIQNGSLYPGYHIVGASAHSLDGPVWAFVSSYTGIPTVIINAPGTPGDAIGPYGQRYVTAINERFDIVGNYDTNYINRITLDNPISGGFINQWGYDGTHSIVFMADRINANSALANEPMVISDATPIIGSGVYAFHLNAVPLVIPSPAQAGSVHTTVTSNGSLVSTFASQTNVVVQNVMGRLNNHSYNVFFSGNKVIQVESIDGKAPTDQAGAVAALNQLGVTPDMLKAVNVSTVPLLDQVSSVFSHFNATPPSAFQTLQHDLSNTADALTLLKAIQTGQPLPIVASGLKVALDISPNSNLMGASEAVSGVMSLMNLDSALQQGDTLGALSAGAQALNFGAEAYLRLVDSSSGAATSLVSDLKGPNNMPGVLAALSLVNDISNHNVVGTALDAVNIATTMGWMDAVPGLQFVAIAYTVFSLVSSFFGGGDSVPDPWGSGHFVWNGDGIGVSAQGQTGGDQAVSGVMHQVLASMNTLIARAQQQNPGSALGIIPNRMPSLGYGTDGYRFTDIDPLTGAQKNPSLRYDTSGKPYNAPAGSPQSFQSLGEAFLYSALARDAIAPEWEVKTAAIQTRLGDPQAGLTEEERAGRAGGLAAAETGASQHWRPVVLDLNGAGIHTVAEGQSNVAFDVDDSGFLKHTGWIANNDAFLVLDRNDNGRIDASRELFSNGQVALDRRGLASLGWVDSNEDGKLTAADPVFDELRVWQDKNGNGVVDAGEETTLAQDGVTSLNYAMGQFTENGAVRQMASPDLTADTAGEKINAIPQGILIQNSGGHNSLLVSRVDDLTQVQANADGVNGVENLETIVSADSLLANDTFGGFSGRDLTMTGVTNVRHGSAYLDANHYVHFQPQTNYYGAGAGFDYTVAAPNGQTGTADVEVTLQHVNEPPVVTGVTHAT